MFAYDLQRYHPEFVIVVVDQVFEDIRHGLEVGFVLTTPSWVLPELKFSSDEPLQVQPAPYIDHEISRRALHLSCD